MQQGNFVEELRTSYNVLQSTLAGLGHVANPRKDHMEEIRPSVWGSSALVLSGELCIATGACSNGEVMGSTSGTMTGYEIVNRAIHVCVLYCLLGVWLFFHVYCWPLLPLLLGDW